MNVILCVYKTRKFGLFVGILTRTDVLRTHFNRYVFNMIRTSCVVQFVYIPFFTSTVSVRCTAITNACLCNNENSADGPRLSVAFKNFVVRAIEIPT